MKSFTNLLLRAVVIVSLVFGLSLTTSAQTKKLLGVQDHTSIAQIGSSNGEGMGVNFLNPYTNVRDTYFAGVFNGTLNSTPTKFYCIDINTHLARNEDYWDEGNTPTEITYILNHYFPFNTTNYPGKLSDINKEAAAIQFAIWNFSDGVDVNQINNNNDVKNRANAIIADAIANSGINEFLETILIIPPSQFFVEGTTAYFDVYTTDINGIPFGNASVQLSTNLGTLGSTSVTTDANGHAGPISLSYSGIGTATISAKANVTIPQGTRYVYKAGSNLKQKLVLATPSFDTKEVYASVTWYKEPGTNDCDLKGYTTFTQGGWGSSSNSAPGKIRDMYFSTVFPTGLVIGSTYKLTLTSAAAVKNFLPQGSTAGAFTQNYTDATSTSAGVFAGQLVALKLNVAFDAAGKLGSNSTDLGDLIILNGPFMGTTVNAFLALAEQAIGGGSLNGHTFSEFNDAATAINENFDNGTVDNGFLTCIETLKASLGDRVWKDLDKDGIQDSGEPGIPNVTVKLYDCGNNLIATTTTDANGNYLFSNLNPGSYYVLFVKPSGYVFTTKDAGSNDAIDSDADVTTGKTICTTLSAGENDLTWDAGLYEECKNTIGSYVYRDLNVNGTKNSGEPGISGAVVELLQGTTVIATATTDANGHYSFPNLLNGTYIVRLAASNFASGGVFFNTTAVKWYTKNSASVNTTLNCNDNLSINFGYYKTCIGITKTADKTTYKPGDIITYTITVENCGDIQLHGGVDVYDSRLWGTTAYHIDIIDPGQTYTIPAANTKYTVTANDCGNLTNSVRAEGHPIDGSATVIAETSVTVTVDCNVCKNTIGSYVYRDLNVNGSKDSGEPGIAGAIVELLQGTTVIATATTDINGHYSFPNLLNGSYTVRLAASNFASGGVFFNTAQTKWYTKNSTSVNTTLNCNDNLSINFGYYKTCVSIIKSSDKQSYNNGETIIYSFIVENCGDIQLHGGIDIFDVMLNPNGDHLIKHIDVLNPGQSTTFTYNYNTTANDCGQITNTARAEGHPVEGSSENCNTQGFITYTPGGWGAPANGNNAGTLRDAYFSLVFPSGLTVGGNYTLILTNAAAVEAFLPSGGIPAALTQNYTNPGSSLSNTLAGHIVSNTLAVKFNEAGYLGTNPTLLGNLIIASGTFAGMSVNQFLVLANTALGGGTTGYSLSDFTATATAINENFDNGTVDNGFLICSNGSISYATVVDESSWTVTVICQEEADVKVEKTVDNPNPNCDDNVTFTIKASNLGPNTASGVQVIDLLPAGLNYISSTATQGTYNSTTGIWNVGTLASGAFATLTIQVKVDCGDLNGSAFDLGTAKDYNLFVIEDVNQPSSDTQGKVAVGRDASFSNYSIGDQLPANSGDVLIVGRDLTFTSGAVYNGNVVYGHATNLPQSSVSITGGILRKDNPIDFATAKAYLENLSTTLAAYTVNGTTTFQWGGITLTGSDPFLNVFTISGASLSSANNISINVPNGSVVLVNISGTNISWTGGLVVSGTAISNVLYNFYQATSLTISGIDIKGSLLAPFAAVNFVSGVINGQMICKSLTGMGQFNYNPFGGHIPIDKKITNVATITSITLDPNPSNNSSSVTVTVAGTTDGNNGNGNNGNGTITSLCTFGQGEIVYSLAYSGNAIYAGTWGGKIYKSTDGGKNWIVINAGMNVSFIWSLNLTGGVIFAATEQGVYKYNGTTWVLTSLTGKDVHALALYNGTLYAGTWGFGVFKSTDLGATWTEMNNGLGGFLTIQALTIRSSSGSGHIYAGTVGGGLFKCNDGINWTKLNFNYNAVWSLVSTSTAIFAGTYGDGLYKSTNSGYSFTKVTSLNVSFVYSMAVDLSGKIYVSSLTNGVFVSSDNGTTWTSLGMGGYGVSAMIVNPNSDDVYVGTKAGQVYKISGSKSVTDVGNDVTPTEYKLAQNYPNPFNPSTSIEFVVPSSGMYSLKVYNVLGQEVANLVENELASGLHKINFDASKLASGMYIYKLTGNNVNLSKKMLLMK